MGLQGELELLRLPLPEKVDATWGYLVTNCSFCKSLFSIILLTIGSKSSNNIHFICTKSIYIPMSVN